MTVAIHESTTDIAAKKAASAEIIEAVLLKGDLGALTPAERVSYYRAVCDSVGLNPLTQPFQYITFQGKLTLYARRDATEQLRRIHGISVERIEHSLDSETGIFMVIAYGRDRDGRTDTSTGAVPVSNLKGEALSNAYMKAETKAKRRLTLSLAGLGWLDESETDSIPGARTEVVNVQTGEVLVAPVRQQIDAELAKPVKPLAPLPKRKVKNPAADAHEDPEMDAAFTRDEMPAEGGAKAAPTVHDPVRNESGGQSSPSPSAGAEPEWLDLPLPIHGHEWSKKTWRWLLDGDGKTGPAKPGSHRWRFVSGLLAEPERLDKKTRQHCELAMMMMEERAKQGGASDADTTQSRAG